MENKTSENIIKYKDELTAETLQGIIDNLQAQVGELTTEIFNKEKTLRDINKPTITQKQLDTINEAISNYTDNVEFSEQDFDVELCMEYDNRIEISSLCFNSSGDMFDDIMRYVEKEFRVIQEEETSTDES
jgi:hypothetical protein|tara:strand:+ start:2989 stop:3381 length:393 start_codon:yes stop_codon:yes gene_type:complete